MARWYIYICVIFYPSETRLVNNYTVRTKWKFSGCSFDEVQQKIFFSNCQLAFHERLDWIKTHRNRYTDGVYYTPVCVFSYQLNSIWFNLFLINYFWTFLIPCPGLHFIDLKFYVTTVRITRIYRISCLWGHTNAI